MSELYSMSIKLLNPLLSAKQKKKKKSQGTKENSYFAT